MPPSTLPRLDVTQVLDTATYTVCCPDEATRTITREFLADFGDVFVDLAPGASGPERRRADLVIAPGLTAAATRDVTLRDVNALLSEAGTVCFVGDATRSDELLAAAQNAGLGELTELDGDRRVLIMRKNVSSKEPRICSRHVVLVQDESPSGEALQLQSFLEKSLRDLGHSTSAVSFSHHDLTGLRDKTCIALMELSRPLLRDLRERDFNAVKEIVLGAESIFWLAAEGSDPSSAMVAGLARVVRNEIPGMSFRTVHVDAAALLGAPETVAELAAAAFASPADDTEFLIKDGLVQVARVVLDVELNARMEQMAPMAVEERILGETTEPLKLAFGAAGDLDSLRFEYDAQLTTDLQRNEVEIDIRATVLRYVYDRKFYCSNANGRSHREPTANAGAAGIVRRIGPGATKFKPGDRVVICSATDHSTVQRSSEGLCELIPETLTFEDAARLPSVYGAAWHAFFRLTQISQGQFVFIEAATGLFGQVAAQIARGLGAEVLISAESDAQGSLFREISDHHISSSTHTSVTADIKRITGGHGVNVMISSSWKTWHLFRHAVAPFGTVVHIGADEESTHVDMRPLLEQQVTLSFMDPERLLQKSPESMAVAVRGVSSLLRQGIIHLVSLTSSSAFSIADLAGAFKWLGGNNNISDTSSAPVTLSFEPSAVVSVQGNAIQQQPLGLDPNGVYILAGGFGGIGRSLSVFLAQNGARKLCLISRSGAESPQAQNLVRRLEALGAAVRVYACDITDPGSLTDAMSDCRRAFGGPVRGVMQCAMVLRDTLFRDMNQQQWVESTRPKVVGTWNLHRATADDRLDFFLTLSSFAGVFGNRGQANYAAAGAFQDALAHFRRARGLPAVTVDLGIVRDVGVLAEQGMIDALRDWEEPYGLREAEVHRLVALAIAGGGVSVDPQVVTGIATGGSAVAAGIAMPYYLEDARFAAMAGHGVGTNIDAAVRSNAAAASSSIGALITQSVSLAEASGHVAAALAARVAAMQEMPVADIDTARSLNSYGVDSLVAIDVANWALKEVQSQVSVFDVMASVPINAVAEQIAAGSRLLPDGLV
ncbi:Beta-ketoacyl synthase [Macrophomina phaseolina MS6]|uniref:Beta-ketoacyl synthase n=1 Tax=Macrophomina phaseolina (strain MS6) TaxID=1126212 RepID=K2R9U4_MACPH|nr:Beta-ketoacyl synthase [Macrophomina phaseolina MS6]